MNVAQICVVMSGHGSRDTGLAGSITSREGQSSCSLGARVRRTLAGFRRGRCMIMPNSLEVKVTLMIWTKENWKEEETGFNTK